MHGVDPAIETETLILPAPTSTRKRFIETSIPKASSAKPSAAAHKLFGAKNRATQSFASVLNPSPNVPAAVSGAYAALLHAGLRADVASRGQTHAAESILWQRAWRALSAPAVLIASLVALAGGEDEFPSDVESDASGDPEGPTAAPALLSLGPVKRPRAAADAASDDSSATASCPSDDGDEEDDDDEAGAFGLFDDDDDADASSSIAADGDAPGIAACAIRRYAGAAYAGPLAVPPDPAVCEVGAPTACDSARVAAIGCLVALATECGVEVPALLPTMYDAAGDVSLYAVPAWPALLARILVKGADSIPHPWLAAFLRRLTGLATSGRCALRVGGVITALVRDVAAAAPPMVRLIHRRRGAVVRDAFEFDGPLDAVAPTALSGTMPELGLLMSHPHSSVSIPAAAITQSLAAPTLSVASGERAAAPWCASQVVTTDICTSVRALANSARSEPPLAARPAVNTPIGPLI